MNFNFPFHCQAINNARVLFLFVYVQRNLFCLLLDLFKWCALTFVFFLFSCVCVVVCFAADCCCWVAQVYFSGALWSICRRCDTNVIKCILIMAKSRVSVFNFVWLYSCCYIAPGAQTCWRSPFRAYAKMSHINSLWPHCTHE